MVENLSFLCLAHTLEYGSDTWSLLKNDLTSSMPFTYSLSEAHSGYPQVRPCRIRSRSLNHRAFLFWRKLLGRAESSSSYTSLVLRRKSESTRRPYCGGSPRIPCYRYHRHEHLFGSCPAPGWIRLSGPSKTWFHNVSTDFNGNMRQAWHRGWMWALGAGRHFATLDDVCNNVSGTLLPLRKSHCPVMFRCGYIWLKLYAYLFPCLTDCLYPCLHYSFGHFCFPICPLTIQSTCQPIVSPSN